MAHGVLDWKTVRISREAAKFAVSRSSCGSSQAFS